MSGPRYAAAWRARAEQAVRHTPSSAVPGFHDLCAGHECSTVPRIDADVLYIDVHWLPPQHQLPALQHLRRKASMTPGVLLQLLTPQSTRIPQLHTCMSAHIYRLLRRSAHFAKLTSSPDCAATLFIQSDSAPSTRTVLTFSRPAMHPAAGCMHCTCSPLPQMSDIACRAATMSSRVLKTLAAGADI